MPPWGGLLPRANWSLRTRRGWIAQRRVYPRPVAGDLDALERVQRGLLARGVGARVHALSDFTMPMSDSMAALSRGDEIDPIDGRMPFSRMVLDRSSDTYCEP